MHEEEGLPKWTPWFFIGASVLLGAAALWSREPVAFVASAAMLLFAWFTYRATRRSAEDKP